MKTKITQSNINSFATKALVLVFLLILALNSFAQPSFYNNNTGATGNAFPLNSTTSNQVQWIYGPGVFRTAGATGTASGNGTITKVYFRLTTVSATASYQDYTISLGQSVGTATTWTSTTWATGLTRCFYQATFQMTGVVANSWYGITLQTPFVYDASKSLVFELKVRSGTGNTVAQNSVNSRIWGLYGATAGSSYGTGLVDFGMDLMKGGNDAGMSAITTPLCTPAISATYSNNGLNAIDSVKIDWSVNGALQNQHKYNTQVASGKSVSINFTPDFNFVDGTTYNIKTWTSSPNGKKDTIPMNDTAYLTFKYQGPAGIKSYSDIIKCGPGKVNISVTPLNQGDSIVWYDKSTGGNVIAKGKSTFTPPLVIGENTFYAQAFKIGSPNFLANSMTPSTGYGGSYVGGMLDITPKTDLVVDSFEVKLINNIAGATYSVYMKTGTYIGSETNPTAWTQIVNNQPTRVFMKGTYPSCFVKIPETLLSKGTTYGFYVTCTPTVVATPWSIATVTGGLTLNNNDMTVFQDKTLSNLFASVITNLPLTMTTYYRTMNCPSSRVPVKVTVKPSPFGAAFIKSTPFQTTQPNTSGSVGSPDIVAKGDKIAYEITPPTGYNNSDYGTTWTMTGFTFRTKSGRVLPASYYTPSAPVPAGAANAKVTFTADADVVDSTIIMTVSIRDLGPHFCDSTLTRNIFVAPRPIADFKFQQPVCDGDNVIFTNASTVSSGNIQSKWDFGTGNPADTATNTDVVFVFPTYGTYDVKLITTTVPYGYTDTKTIQVVVTEIPKIGFNVRNACLGDSVKFLNSTTISKGTITYKWDLGNGTTSIKANPGVKYAQAGGYKVTLTATSNGCSQTLTKNAQQFARPVAKYNAPAVLCDKTQIRFTNGSTIPIGNMGYLWNFGDGTISGETNPFHSFTSAGNKSVKMKVISEFGCADSITKTITLAEAPSASFTTGSVCNLSPTSFTFTGSKPTGYLTNFNWKFADEGSTSVENPTKLFSTVGKKLITLTLTSNNGCGDVISKEIDVKLQSKADFQVTDVCDGDEAVFTNNSSVSSGSLLYNWKFGDGKNSAVQSPRHIYPNGSQTYNVTLVAIVPGGCSDSINKPISVNAKPSSNFNFNTSGRLVNFNAAQVGNTTYQWDFSDGGKASNASTQYHYTNYPSGKYVVCLTVVNAAGCQSQTCKEVAITGGINKLSVLNGVTVFPNPNNGNFTVTVENPKSDIAIAVYNLLGEMVKTIETSPLKSTYSVDLNVANGVYLVKVTNGGLISTQKITINR